MRLALGRTLCSGSGWLLLSWQHWQYRAPTPVSPCLAHEETCLLSAGTGSQKRKKVLCILHYGSFHHNWRGCVYIECKVGTAYTKKTQLIYEENEGSIQMSSKPTKFSQRSKQCMYRKIPCLDFSYKRLVSKIMVFDILFNN